MTNRVSSYAPNQSLHIPIPDVATNSPIDSSVPLPSPTNISGPYKVFISHGGEDKVTIAMPLRQRLEERGITAFVDKMDMTPGTEAEQAMLHAMETSIVGVFVMSPEFVARRWPMKELMRFFSRLDEAKRSGLEPPVITPFFYRLSIPELYQEPRLDRKDKDGNNLYEKSRFYERQRNEEPETDVTNIKDVMKRLHNIMGVENIVAAGNDSSYAMWMKREMLLEKLSMSSIKLYLDPQSRVHS